MVETPACAFVPARIVATLAALDVLAGEGVDAKLLITRHLCGDWGDLDPETCRMNDASLAFGARLLSSYILPSGRRIWIVTEADRSYTCLLLPEEY